MFYVGCSYRYNVLSSPILTCVVVGWHLLCGPFWDLVLVLASVVCRPYLEKIHVVTFVCRTSFYPVGRYKNRIFVLLLS